MSAVAAYQDQVPGLPKNGSARAAILLIALGSSGASRILKHFSSEEIRRLKEAASGLAAIAPEAVEELVDRFQDAFKKAPGLDGPARQMNELLQIALGEDEFQQLFVTAGAEMPGTGPSEPVGNVWEAVAGLEGEVLAPQLAREHPQIVAILLSKVPSDTASIIVRQFEAAFRHAVMRRMMSLRPLSPPVLTLFETHVRQAYLGGAATSDDNGGGHTVLAEIVNRLDKSQTDELLDAIRSVQPADADTLQKLLFAFEDVAGLSQKARLTLFDAVPTETVILALRGVEGEIREGVLASLGARGRRMVEAELGQAVDVQASEVEGARRRIASEALRLSAEGRIKLRVSGEEG